MDMMRRDVTLIIQVMDCTINMSDIEKEIVAKNLTAPRVTPDSIQSKIKDYQKGSRNTEICTPGKY